MFPRKASAQRPVSVLLSALLVLVGLVGLTSPAGAAGTPDVTLSLSSPGDVLLGGTVPVTLTASNSSSTPGYNATFKLVVPFGTSLTSSVPAATRQVTPTPGGPTTIIWENVSDLLAGASSSVVAQVSVGAMPPGSTLFAGEVYVNSDPRLVPRFDTSGVVVAGASSYTGNASASRTVERVPFQVERSVDRPENEVVRGAHDQKTGVSLTLSNNSLASSTSMTVVEYVPAELEFLGCGTTDNSASEEYLGSGRISDTPAPVLTGSCGAPSQVDTLQVDPPGATLGMGVYTVVTWDPAALSAIFGSSDLAPGQVRRLAYVMAAPQRVNTLFDDSAPSATSGLQAANLDNNLGASTLETTTEVGASLGAVLSGTYAGTNYSAVAHTPVTLEDVAVQKSVSSSALVQGGVSTWTINLQYSEYASTTAGIVVTDTLPDGLCPLGASSADAECSAGPAPSPAYTSSTENADGSWTLRWDVPDKVANATSQIVFSSRVRQFYQQDGVDAAPVRANDSVTNNVGVTAASSELGAAARPVADVSSASQSASPVSLTKEVASPQSGACGDGSGLAWSTGSSSTLFGLNDVVCWRLTSASPSGLDTTGLLLTDFLPPSHVYVSSMTASTSDVPFSSPTVQDRKVSWELPSGGDLDADSRASVVLTSRIVASPNDYQPGVTSDNLAKLSYKNTPGDIFQLRSSATVGWAEPVLVVDKSSNVTNVDSNDQVDYTVVVSNVGNARATSVVVRDLLPSRLAGCPTSITSGFTCSAGHLDGTFASILPGQSATFTYRVTLPGDVSPDESFTNRAGVRTYQYVPNTGLNVSLVPSNNVDSSLVASSNTSAADDTQVVRSAAVTMSKALTSKVSSRPGNSATQASPGERVDYTVSLTVPKETTMQGASIVDTLPSNVVLLTSPAPTLQRNGVSAPAGFTLTAGAVPNRVTVTFPATYVAPGTAPVFTLTYSALVRNTTLNTAGSSVTNTATLTYQPASGSLKRVNRSATAQVVEPSLSVEKSHSDADGVATPGEVVSFQVRARNASNASPSYETKVVDTLPAAFTPVDGTGAPVADGSSVPSGGVWSASQRTLTWDLGIRQGGESGTRDYQVRVVDPLPVPAYLVNTATVFGSSASGVSSPEERDATSGVSTSRYTSSAEVSLTSPGLSLSKSAGVTTAQVGDVVEYTLQLQVPRDVQTNDVTILDTLPAGTSYVSTQSSSCAPSVACGSYPGVTTVEPASGSSERRAWFVGDLASTTSDRTLTVVYTVRVDDVPGNVSGTVLENSARAGYNATDKVTGTPATAPDASSFDGLTSESVVAVMVLEPGLTLDKRVSGDPTFSDERRARPGDTLTYTILVMNTGTGVAHDVTVEDTLDSRMVVSAPSSEDYVVVDGDSGDGRLEFRVGSIPAGGSVLVTYTVVVGAYVPSDDDPAGFDATNSAVASARSSSSSDAREYTSPVDVVSLELDLARLGDRVWFDVDGDGVQGPAEPGLEGVPVSVTFLGADETLGTSDDEVHTDVTDADGRYLVRDLPGGLYHVALDAATLPPGLAYSFDLDGPASPGTALAGLSEEETLLTVDFGLVGTGSVGDQVWFDQDKDATVDGTEPGVAGVGVTLVWSGQDGVFGNDDDVTLRSSTDADGRYLFTGVPAGPYTITLDLGTLPEGMDVVSGPGTSPTNNTFVGDLRAGENFQDVDFGVAGSASVGDLVWVDQDADGVVDADEPPLPGATVRVRWAGLDGTFGTVDDLVVVSVTDEDGNYLVSNLPAGRHRVDLDPLPAGLVPTFDEDSGTLSPDGSTALTLLPGQRHVSADFGVVAATGVGDVVWLDVDRDGTQGPGEPGISGVLVRVVSAGVDGVLDTSDDVSYATTTSGTGHYIVTGLPAGLTRVSIVSGLPDGLDATFDHDGVTTPLTTEVILLDGSFEAEADFGLAGRSSVGDRLWVDVDKDGVQDPSEPGLPGVSLVVTHLGLDGVLGTVDDLALEVVTGTDGTYKASSLPVGDVQVKVVSLPEGYFGTFDEDAALVPVGDSAGRDLVSLVKDLGLDGPEDHVTADMGVGGAGTLGGVLWWDLDRDGTLDAGDTTHAGTLVVLAWAGPDGTFGTDDDVSFESVTGADGRWLVTDLPPGEYSATVDRSTLPVDAQVVFDRDDLQVSPDGTWSGSLAPSEDRSDVDTGIVGDATLGDLVWVDDDRDSVRDQGEPGVADVELTITWHGLDRVRGTADDRVFNVSTDEDGRYLVSGLPEGVYDVDVVLSTLPAGLAAGSDVDGGSASSSRVALPSASVFLDVDFGLRRPVVTPPPAIDPSAPPVATPPAVPPFLSPLTPLAPVVVGTSAPGPVAVAKALAVTGLPVGLMIGMSLLILGAGALMVRKSTVRPSRRRQGE